jgi:uncharacterized protein
MYKRCTVACDTPGGVLLCELELEQRASIGEALAAARQRLGTEVTDWEHAPVGIYGQVYPREHVPADGDRIEVYRPLPVDPRARRRARAGAMQPRRGSARR